MTSYVNKQSKKVVDALYYDPLQTTEEAATTFFSKWGILGAVFEPYIDRVQKKEVEGRSQITVNSQTWSEPVYFVWVNKWFDVEPFDKKNFEHDHTKLTPANEKVLEKAKPQKKARK